MLKCLGPVLSAVGGVEVWVGLGRGVWDSSVSVGASVWHCNGANIMGQYFVWVVRMSEGRSNSVGRIQKGQGFMGSGWSWDGGRAG